MKTTLVKAVMCVTFIFAGILNINLKAQEKFVTNDIMTGELVTSKIIYRHDGALYRYMKYDFKYDEQGRVIEKESFKWNSTKEEWMPYYKVNTTYGPEQVVMNYAKWNEKTKTYNEAQEKSVYELDVLSAPVAYLNYKRTGLGENWKIIENIKFDTANVLYANNR